MIQITPYIFVCDTCIHRKICQYTDYIRKSVKEIEDMDDNVFTVNVTCKHHKYDKSLDTKQEEIPSITYTNADTIVNITDLSKKDCKSCIHYKDLASGKVIVGDTPCTWCEKMNPICE